MLIVIIIWKTRFLPVKILTNLTQLLVLSTRGYNACRYWIHLLVRNACPHNNTDPAVGVFTVLYYDAAVEFFSPNTYVVRVTTMREMYGNRVAYLLEATVAIAIQLLKRPNYIHICIYRVQAYSVLWSNNVIFSQIQILGFSVYIFITLS